MQEAIFRKKSLDRVQSPEDLNDYIRVANPGIWLLLFSVIVLLVGVCVWGFFGHIDSTVPSAVRIENGEAVCYIAEENISSIRAGLTVKFEDCEAVIDRIGEKGDMGYACTLTTAAAAADGFYEGNVVVESYRPLTFVLN